MLHFPVPHMNRHKETESAVFLLRRFSVMIPFSNYLHMNGFPWMQAQGLKVVLLPVT